jgi:peptidylprolyl isomerase
MNSLAFSVGNYTPRNLSAPNTTLPAKNLDTTKVSSIKFSSHSQENFSRKLQPKESQTFFKRREAIGLGFCAGFLDVLLQQQLTATAEEAPCELTVAPSGLAFCDKIVGTGPEAVKGQLIKVIIFFFSASLKEK